MVPLPAAVIAALSPGDLLRLAAHYQSLSDELRAAAHDKAAARSVERDSARHVERLRTLPQIVAGYRAAGLSPDMAMAAAARAAAVPVETVNAWCRLDARERKAREREARRRAVAAGLEAGRSQREIAREIGVSQGTVSRIARHLRRSTATRTATTRPITIASPMVSPIISAAPSAISARWRPS